jgi:uncharacterized membrane protein YbhN (UPF0104 family)
MTRASGRLTWLLRLAAGLILFWIAFRDIDPSAVGRVFAGLDPWWLAAAVLSVYITVACVVMRWTGLLGGAARGRGWLVLASAVVASQVANIVMPFRLGDAVRIGAVSRALSMPASDVLGSVAVERLLEGSLVAIAAGLLAAFGTLPEFARQGMLGLSAVMVAAVAAAALVTAFRPAVSRWLDGTRGAWGSAGAWIIGQADLVLRGIERMRHIAALARAVLWSAAVLAGSCLTAWLLLRACHLDVPAAAAVLVVIAVQIGSVVVPIPGAVGISQVLTVQTLRLWGVAESPALAYALVLYLTARVPKMLVLPLALPMLAPARTERS